MSNLVFIDFEFFNTKEEKLELVCASLLEYGQRESVESYWLLDSKQSKTTLIKRIQNLKKQGKIFVGYQTAAEAGSFYSLCLTPTDFKWVDLFLEYRCITNQCDEFMYGKQLVDGKIKHTRRPPLYGRTDEDKKKSFKPTHSLAEATYKLTGEIRDTSHKKIMRDIIIEGDKQKIAAHKSQIMEYCDDDVFFLPKILANIIKAYKKLLGPSLFNKDILLEEMLYRGEYQALTGIRERKGYPVDIEKIRTLAKNIPLILQSCQRDINSQFETIKMFKYDAKKRKFTWDKKTTEKWVEENCDTKNWPKTETKELSLKKEAFEKYFSFRHNFPRHNFGAQVLRYQKIDQALKGFKLPWETKRKTFWDYVGEDGVVRPYMNAYGSQSSRSQPGANGFMMLKPAWVRSLVQPPTGKVITSIDYGSEEFFISALKSRDPKMIEAYLSGDVYLAFAKEAGMVPKDGTRKEYEFERNVCKSTVLGISYDMSKYGLAIKLTNETGRNWTEDEAQDMIDKFYSVFELFAEYKQQIQEDYEYDGHIKLPDGYYMWGDNDNFRSVGNCPIQGFGAAVMRKADLLCHNEGLYVPITLHDALYILHDHNDWKAIDTAIECMREGFTYYFDEDLKELASQVRLDVETWGPDCEYETIKTPNGVKVKTETIHIDPRGREQYEQFNQYFYSDNLEVF